MKNPFTIHYHHQAANRYGRWLGEFARKRFEGKLATEQDQPVRPSRSSVRLPINLVTLAGAASFSEAVLMFDSFLAHVGEPQSCSILSDGTLDPWHAKVLARVSPNISIRTVDQLDLDVIPAPLKKRLHAHPLMFKLALMMECARRPPAWCIDSDFLFFPAARDFNWNALLQERRPRYMQDMRASVDPRLADPTELPPRTINAGFVMYNSPVQFDPHVDRLDRMGNEIPHHFSEQTIVHFALTQAGALPLDPKKFILTLDDQFKFRDHYAFHEGVVCRHYATPIRHKFWIHTLFHPFPAKAS